MDLVAAVRAEATTVQACRAIAFGEKACGGPRAYLIYSTSSSDAAEVERLVADFNRLDAERNATCELASDCSFVPEPDVALENGQCLAELGGS